MIFARKFSTWLATGKKPPGWSWSLWDPEELPVGRNPAGAARGGGNRVLSGTPRPGCPRRAERPPGRGATYCTWRRTCTASARDTFVRNGEGGGEGRVGVPHSTRHGVGGPTGCPPPRPPSERGWPHHEHTPARVFCSTQSGAGRPGGGSPPTTQHSTAHKEKFL